MFNWKYPAGIIGVTITGLVVFAMIDEKEYILPPDPSLFSRPTAEAAEGYDLLLEFAAGFRIPRDLSYEIDKLDHLDIPPRSAELTGQTSDWDHAPEQYWDALSHRFKILEEILQFPEIGDRGLSLEETRNLDLSGMQSIIQITLFMAKSTDPETAAYATDRLLDLHTVFQRALPHARTLLQYLVTEGLLDYLRVGLDGLIVHLEPGQRKAFRNQLLRSPSHVHSLEDAAFADYAVIAHEFYNMINTNNNLRRRFFFHKKRTLNTKARFLIAHFESLCDYDIDGLFELHAEVERRLHLRRLRNLGGVMFVRQFIVNRFLLDGSLDALEGDARREALLQKLSAD